MVKIAVDPDQIKTLSKNTIHSHNYSHILGAIQYICLHDLGKWEEIREPRGIPREKRGKINNNSGLRQGSWCCDLQWHHAALGE